MDTLPIEILCAILAQVFEEDKRDLASYSLVSQLWRQIALPQLFETLRISYWIYDVSEDPYLAQREDWHRSPYHILLPSVLAFLTRKPNIAASVRSLELMQDDWNAEATDPEMLFLIFNLLPSLRILELNEVPVGENVSDPSIKLVVDRPLDRLTINTNGCLAWGFEVPPAQYMLRTMSFFRSIDTLRLNGPFCMDRTLADDAASTGSPPLALHAPKHLEIGNVYPLQPLVSMMHSQSLLQNVESLTIDVVVADDSEEMQALEGY